MNKKVYIQVAIYKQLSFHRFLITFDVDVWSGKMETMNQQMELYATVANTEH